MMRQRTNLEAKRGHRAWRVAVMISLTAGMFAQPASALTWQNDAIHFSKEVVTTVTKNSENTLSPNGLYEVQISCGPKTKDNKPVGLPRPTDSFWTWAIGGHQKAVAHFVAIASDAPAGTMDIQKLSSSTTAALVFSVDNLGDAIDARDVTCGKTLLLPHPQRMLLITNATLSNTYAAGELDSLASNLPGFFGALSWMPSGQVTSDNQADTSVKGIANLDKTKNFVYQHQFPLYEGNMTVLTDFSTVTIAATPLDKSIISYGNQELLAAFEAMIPALDVPKVSDPAKPTPADAQAVGTGCSLLSDKLYKMGITNDSDRYFAVGYAAIGVVYGKPGLQQCLSAVGSSVASDDPAVALLNTLLPPDLR